MADVYGNIGIRVTDERYETVSTPLYFKVADTTTLAALVADAQDMQETFQGVTGGECVKCWVTLAVPLGTTSSPTAGAVIEKTMLLKALTPNGFVRHYGVDVPAALDNFFNAGTKQVNLAATNVAAFINRLTESTGLIYTGPSGHVISEVVDGRMTFRKHRRVANRS